MMRKRVMILATTASVALSGAVVPSAIAGSHWSRQKCTKTYSAWYKQHVGPLGKVPSTKQTKEAVVYVKALEKQHRCVFGG